MEAFMGTIMPVAFNFAPRGWMLCQGQLLSISEYSALYALLGTNYGGNGTTTFALPDLRGRTMIGTGPVPGGPNVTPGETLGAFNNVVAGNVVLDASHLPAHTHPVALAPTSLTATSTLHATSGGPGTNAPAAGAMLGATGVGPGGAAIYYSGSEGSPVSLNANSVTTTLGGTVSGDTQANPGPATANLPFSLNVSTLQPSLGINYVICVLGIFPSRN